MVDWNWSGSSVDSRAGPTVSYSIAATNAPSTLPLGLVKASVAVNASSIVPASTSASMNSKPSVAAARGIGARPSTPSQNGPDRPLIVPPHPSSRIRRRPG
jgi:hypothetical protein